MVPEGWVGKRLGEVTEFQRGFDLPKANRIAGKIPIISSGGLTGSHNEPKVVAPGLVTGRYGSIGVVYKTYTDFWPLNTTLWVKDFHNNDFEYCYYFLQSIDYAKFSDKTGVPGINRNDIHRIKVILPPLPEQRKIAEILSTWDRAIEVSEALLATARSQKRALMQALLTGQRRFPEFEGQEWKEVMLGDVVSAIRGGGTPDKSNPEYWTGTIPWVSVKDLKSDRLYTTVDTISELGLNNSASNAFDADTIIISTRMAVGVTVRLGCRMAINQDLKAVIPTKAVRNDYLFHCLQMNQPKLEALGTGSTVKGVTLGDLRRMPIGYPKNVDEQDRIVQVVENASEKVLALVGNIQHLRTEKKALMQQLLTGKRRVTV